MQTSSFPRSVLKYIICLYLLLDVRPLCIVISFLVFWTICQSSFLVHFKNWPVSYKKDSPSVYPFDEVPVVELGFEKFSRSSEILFLKFFFHLSLFDGVCFQYFQVFLGFLFSEPSDSFLFWQPYSFPYLSFPSLLLLTLHVFLYIELPQLLAR